MYYTHSDYEKAYFWEKLLLDHEDFLSVKSFVSFYNGFEQL